ncbi:GerAB/ArcD/ProY family transporter [Sporomusa termitida]|uniref:Spore germination protein YndE n=1 Tax=Sporomusa termitida TaxID=2377 RepID=A0A517E179_9FIRM|nr:GerAB/ArcD/ProY family transporter [Sporomusa termitida]QDR83353.1 Spore germination protein YndE [Sporomusa termitida]
MANLEAKNKMSVAQFGLFLTAVMFGTQIIGLPTKVVPQAEQFAWVSVVLSGGLYFIAVWILMKLGEIYPGQDYTAYLPQLLGKWPGLTVVAAVLLLLVVFVWVIFNQFSRGLAFFMFDRTPYDVIIMGMLGVVIYCALQDLGTIIRITQFTFFVSTVMMGSIWILGLFNFQPENLLPLWTDKPWGIVEATFSTWGVYGGYEIILLLFPVINRTKGRLVLALALAIGFVMLISFVVVIITIGVLSVEGVKNESYPVLVVVRSVELPGTFIERLENYLLIAWIPSVFNTMAVLVYAIGQTLSRVSGFADHRPWILAVTPVIFLGATLLDGMEMIKVADKMVNWLGAVLSLGIMPLIYLLARRSERRRMSGAG